MKVKSVKQCKHCDENAYCLGLCTACYSYIYAYSTGGPSKIMHRMEKIDLNRRRLESIGAARAIPNNVIQLDDHRPKKAKKATVSPIRKRARAG